MSEESNKERLSHIEGKVDIVVEFVTNHLSHLPEEVGNLKGQNKVIMVMLAGIIGAVGTLLVRVSV